MELDPRLHFVVATAIIVRDGRYLIIRRGLHEKAFPGKWTVPGGKLVTREYRELPPTVASYDGWYGLLDWLVRKEVREEVRLEIGKIGYVTDVVFFRPDGYPVVTLSFWAPWRSGEVQISKDFDDHAWVRLEDAKHYDLIEGIWDELAQVDKILKSA